MDKNYYKISPELKEFVIKTAQGRPEVGCRKISALVQEQFKIDISKSTVAAILKAGSLNQPVGRRSLRKKPLTPLSSLLPAPSLPCTSFGMGCWFMKAADLCLAGREIISKIISAHFKDTQAPDVAAKNETLFYLASFGGGLDGLSEETLRGIVGREFAKEEIKKYIAQLKAALPLDEERLREISACRREVLAVQCTLEDKSSFYIDASGHTVWTGLRMPGELSAGLYKAENWRNEIIEGERPLILQAAPGFEAPSSAFLNFIHCFQAQDTSKALRCISLVGDDNKIISENSQPIPSRKRYFIFGLWPWQYQKFRAPSSSGHIEVRSNADPEQGISLRAIAYDSEKKEQVLTLITNIEESAGNDVSIRLLYRERWPNIEIGYQDFLEKIGHLSSRNNLIAKGKIMSNISFQGINPLKLLISWRQELNCYCQRHFFPLAYQGVDFAVMKERFYGLKGRLEQEANGITIILYAPENFPYFEELRYGCLRVSEADVRSSDGRKLNFACGLLRP
jgi:hypothetical protein